MRVAVAVLAAIVSSGTTLAFRSIANCRTTKRQVGDAQKQQQDPTSQPNVEATASSLLGAPQDAALRLQQLQQERDELAQQLTHLEPYLRSVSTRQRDSSNLQCLLQGLQQLHDLTQQSHAIAAQQVQSSTASITSTVAVAAAVGQPLPVAVPHGPGRMLEDEAEALFSWGSGLRHTSTSDGGALQQCSLQAMIEPQPQESLATLTPTEEADAAAPTTLEEWGSGHWSRHVSTGGAEPSSRLSPACSGIGAASRPHSRLAVVSSIGAVGLDSWGSGKSAIHQQHHEGTASAKEDEDAQQVQQQQLAASMALVEQLQSQLAEAQEQRLWLQQQVMQHQVENQSLQQLVQQLQTFAQQQQEKLAYSDEIISWMQSLAGRLATIRLSRESSIA
uniref:Uncharacterized protein n=1 Tax=Tetradesmus obliquus TaxID=3088 RepID=A0A383WK78_TETOB|eukprot:jgi/Sobl393_1/14471/SZX77534.1